MRRRAGRRALVALFIGAGGAGCIGDPRPPYAVPAPQADGTAGDANAPPFVIPPVDNTQGTAAPGPNFAGFAVADAASFQFAANQGVAGVTAQVTASTTAHTCDDANANVLRVGQSRLVIQLKDLSDAQMAAASYVFPAAADAPYEIIGASLAAVSAPCTYGAVDALVAGTVTLTAVQPAALSGSFSLQFAGGTVSGSFSAPTCAALAATPAAAPTCLAPAAP